MRLDLVLKQSGLIKRRTIAKEFSENGKVLINNEKIGKPSSEIKSGDVLLLSFGPKKVLVQIDFVKKGKKEVPIFVVINEG